MPQGDFYGGHSPPYVSILVRIVHATGLIQNGRIDTDGSACHFFSMQAIKVATTVEKEGELHLTNLPVHLDQRVEVIVLISEEKRAAPSPAPPQVNEEEWQRLIDTVRQSEPHFPTLDEAMNFTRSRP